MSVGENDPFSSGRGRETSSRQLKTDEERGHTILVALTKFIEAPDGTMTVGPNDERLG